MNDETEKLQEMLERATAPGPQLSAGLDPETASLRATWLALGRLLEDVQPSARRSWPNVSRGTALPMTFQEAFLSALRCIL